MPKRDLAYTLAEYGAGIRLTDLPAATVAAAKRNIFDTLACAVAGSSAPGSGEVVALVQEWGGAPQATVLVHGLRAPAHHAAWCNGTMAHAREYDDTHDAAVLHAGVSVIPAALAAAELSGAAGGADFLAAVTAGLDLVCRLGVATSVGLTESGWMYTSIFGHFGATLAAGRVLGLDPGQMLNALGIVYSQVAGNHQVTRDAALTKRMQPGFAAQAALLSVQLAHKGVRGAQETFEGADGFFRVYLHNRIDPAVLTADLGRRFEPEQLSYKPYPSCRFTHAPIDAALAVRRRAHLDPAAIRKVQVRVNRQCYEAVCTPEAVRRAPTSVVQAQFSIPYTVAVALLQGQVGLQDFTAAALQRPEVLALAARVEGLTDPGFERDWGRSISPASVRVETAAGAWEERVDFARGHVKNPMTPAEFDAKLRDCLRCSLLPLPEDAGGQLRTLVDGLETLANAGELARPLVTARPPPGD